MTREEYISQRKELVKKIALLEAEKLELDKAYIEANKKFDHMDIVEITTPAHKVTNLTTGQHEKIPERKRMGIVIGNHIDYEDNVKPTVRKMKKNGTMSSIKDYIMQGEILKKTGRYSLAENSKKETK